jgi:uncharacterized tellurite resistance protein B-like protein
MLKSIGNLLQTMTGAAVSAPPDREHALQLATALLLVEVARADYAEDPTEDVAMQSLLKEFFDLSRGEAEILIAKAGDRADHAASLHEFTRQLHAELTIEEKHKVIEMLWTVAMADEHLDKHEDHLVRKIAGLLYIPHSDLIRIRNQVRERRS